MVEKSLDFSLIDAANVSCVAKSLFKAKWQHFCNVCVFFSGVVVAFTTRPVRCFSFSLSLGSPTG